MKIPTPKEVTTKWLPKRNAKRNKRIKRIMNCIVKSMKLGSSAHLVSGVSNEHRECINSQLNNAGWNTKWTAVGVAWIAK